MRQAGLKISAVLIGLAADLGASLAVGAIFGLGVGLWLARAGTGPAELAQLVANPVVIAFSLVVGAACCALGGYVAARLAPHAPRLHGAVVGVASAAVGALAQSHGMAGGPAWASLLGYALAVPAALAGAAFVATDDGPGATAEASQ